eukprot:403368534
MQRKEYLDLQEQSQSLDESTCLDDGVKKAPRYLNIFESTPQETKTPNFKDFDSNLKKESILRTFKQFKDKIGNKTKNLQTKISAKSKRIGKQRNVDSQYPTTKQIILQHKMRKEEQIVESQSQKIQRNILLTPVQLLKMGESSKTSDGANKESQQNIDASTNKQAQQTYCQNGQEATEQLNQARPQAPFIPPINSSLQKTNQIDGGQNLQPGNLNQDQQVALRNVRLKQFLFDLTMHESCGKTAQMPSSRYLSIFADALNILASSVNDRNKFARLVRLVIPVVTDQNLDQMIEALKVTQLVQFVSFLYRSLNQHIHPPINFSVYPFGEGLKLALEFADKFYDQQKDGRQQLINQQLHKSADLIQSSQDKITTQQMQITQQRHQPQSI